MILWQISNYATLDGEGGKLFPARWHSSGRAIVYTADHPASSLCEMLANTDAGSLPSSFQLLKISVKEIRVALQNNLIANWVENVEFTRKLGDKWLEESNSAILRVPSALLPEAYNYLINPVHPDIDKITIEQKIRIPLDPRLR
jgi:RES domain-containing protein